MKITFFNHFHNGDIHVSRSIVRIAINKLKEMFPDASFNYAHKHALDLIGDLDNLSHLKVDGLVASEHVTVQRRMHSSFGKHFLLNTWYGQDNFKHLNRYGITMDCLVSALDDNCHNLFGFKPSDMVKDPSDLFPSINYSKYKLQSVKAWLSQHPEQKIFVSNGHALSGQAENFSMGLSIYELAKCYPNKTFILSSKEQISPLPNLVYSSDIIKKSGSDLNENSFLTTHCDVIIGRASGPFTFAFVKENLFQRAPKFICFSNLTEPAPNKFWLGDSLKDKINYSAKIILSEEKDIKLVQQLIDGHLQ